MKQWKICLKPPLLHSKRYGWDIFESFTLAMISTGIRKLPRRRSTVESGLTSKPSHACLVKLMSILEHLFKRIGDRLFLRLGYFADMV